MKPQFDPYDMLISLAARLQEVEQKHNSLAAAYEKTENELTIALHSIKNLQKLQVNTSHNLSRLIKELQQNE